MVKFTDVFDSWQMYGYGVLTGVGYARSSMIRGILHAPVRAVAWPALVGVSKAVAPLAYGYLLGATAGTAISGYFWGKEGAREAIDVYTSPTKFGEAFMDIPEHAAFIAEHYWDELWD